MAARIVPVICLVALVLAGCSSQSNPNLKSYLVGPLGHQIRIDAAIGQHVAPASAGGHSAGSSALPGVNYATSLALPDNGNIEVAVSIPSGPVTADHARWIINDFFNNVPERLTVWRGTAADLGVRPCSTPAGPCPGYVGGFQVFRSGVLYNVFLTSGDSETAWAVLHSIRIPATTTHGGVRQTASTVGQQSTATLVVTPSSSLHNGEVVHVSSQASHQERHAFQSAPHPVTLISSDVARSPQPNRSLSLRVTRDRPPSR